MGAAIRVQRQVTSLSSSVFACEGLSRIASAAIAAGGTGYKLGDTLTLAGGTVLTRAAIFQVTAVSPNGVVTQVRIFNARTGAYSTKPSNPVSTTTNGAGSGCTLTVTWANNVVSDEIKAITIQAEAQAIRVRQDGTTPTAAIGDVIAAGASQTFVGNLGNIKMIEAAASAKAMVTFWG